MSPSQRFPTTVGLWEKSPVRRTRQAPIIGEIDPEAAADTLAIALWSVSATAMVKLFPSTTEWMLTAEWFYLLSVVMLSIAVSFSIVLIPMSYMGFFDTDRTDVGTEWGDQDG